MNQIINTDSKNSKEPQQKYRIGTVSIKILGGLNRFYRRLTSPSASIMAQNKAYQTPTNRRIEKLRKKPNVSLHLNCFLDCWLMLESVFITEKCSCKSNHKIVKTEELLSITLTYFSILKKKKSYFYAY